MKYVIPSLKGYQGTDPIPKEYLPSALPKTKPIKVFEQELIQKGFKTKVKSKIIDRRVFYCLSGFKPCIMYSVERQKNVHFVYFLDNGNLCYYGLIGPSLDLREDGDGFNVGLFTVYQDIPTIEKLNDNFFKERIMIGYGPDYTRPIIDVVKNDLKRIEILHDEDYSFNLFDF